VDQANNESASSTQANETASPITQTVAVSGGGTATLTFTIRNNGATGDNVTVTTMTISWSTVSRTVQRIYCPSGTQVWPASGNGSGANGVPITLSIPFTLNGQTSTTMDIRWSGTMALTNNVWVMYNDVDGYINLY
jgi:hypothetical protein